MQNHFNREIMNNCPHFTAIENSNWTSSGSKILQIYSEKWIYIEKGKKCFVIKFQPFYVHQFDTIKKFPGTFCTLLCHTDYFMQTDVSIFEFQHCIQMHIFTSIPQLKKCRDFMESSNLLKSLSLVISSLSWMVCVCFFE